MVLPALVSELLNNNNLLHLGTCQDNVPSVSLMSFSFVPPSESAPPMIILSSPPGTQKVANIKANPQVSVLIHDWTSQSLSSSKEGTDISKDRPSQSYLSQFLEKLNQSQLSQTSVTLYGHARIPAGEEAEYYRSKHLDSNPNAQCFIENADIVLVVPHSAKVADSSNNVESYEL